MTTWLSREQWAIEHRTFYNDDDIRVSAKAADYASPEEIAAAIAEAKALWTEMGRQVKAAGPAITPAEWNRRYHACRSREERNQLYDSPEYSRLQLSRERSKLNLDIVKKLVAGFVPDNGFRTNGATAIVSLCGGKDYTDKLPKAATICHRQYAARQAAIEAKEAEYAARPVDDVAWEAELKRRASMTRK
jgi:hypothetical protein